MERRLAPLQAHLVTRRHWSCPDLHQGSTEIHSLRLSGFDAQFNYVRDVALQHLSEAWGLDCMSCSAQPPLLTRLCHSEFWEVFTT